MTARCIITEDGVPCSRVQGHAGEHDFSQRNEVDASAKEEHRAWEAEAAKKLTALALQALDDLRTAAIEENALHTPGRFRCRLCGSTWTETTAEKWPGIHIGKCPFRKWKGGPPWETA